MGDGAGGCGDGDERANTSSLLKSGPESSAENTGDDSEEEEVAGKEERQNFTFSDGEDRDRGDVGIEASGKDGEARGKEMFSYVSSPRKKQKLMLRSKSKQKSEIPAQYMS